MSNLPAYLNLLGDLFETWMKGNLQILTPAVAKILTFHLGDQKSKNPSYLKTLIELRA
jgi:hypothetical protein